MRTAGSLCLSVADVQDPHAAAGMSLAIRLTRTAERTFVAPQGWYRPSSKGAMHELDRSRDWARCTRAEVLGSLKCDCAEQLRLAMRHLQDCPPGIIIYLQQEGRGIGLANKIAAYSLQVRRAGVPSVSPAHCGYHPASVECITCVALSRLTRAGYPFCQP